MYIYSWEDTGDWSLKQTLTGNHGEKFGAAIALDGMKALIGAPNGGLLYFFGSSISYVLL